MRRTWNAKEPFSGGKYAAADPRANKNDSMLAPSNQYVRFFRHYGVTLFENDQQMRGDCPFPDCQKEDHFYANPASGQWDCKRCGRKGNTYDFIRELHAALYVQMTDELYEHLASLRKPLRADILKEWQIVYMPSRDHWLLPAFGSNGNMVNLYSWGDWEDPKTGKVTREVRSGPTFKQVLYGLGFVGDDRNIPINVMEGHWDTIACHQMLTDLGLLKKYDFCGVPGAGTHPQPELFEGRDVRLYFDADDAGRRGTAQFYNSMASKQLLPKKSAAIDWPEGTENGYDIRDLLEAFGDAKQTHKYMLDALTVRKVTASRMDNEGYDANVVPRECHSFEQCIAGLRQSLSINKVWEWAFAVGCANVVAKNLSGPMVWDYILGASGSGKSTLTSLIGAAHQECYTASYFTRIFSGFGGKGDTSLLGSFNNRVVIIPDFTTFLSSPATQQQQMMGQLRTVYEDCGEVTFGNGVKNNVNNIRFGMLVATTRAVRRFNMSELGERILQFEMDTDWTDECDIVALQTGEENHAMHRRVVSNVLKQIATRSATNNTQKFLEEKGITVGFIDHLVSMAGDMSYVSTITKNIEEDEEFLEFVHVLCEWTSACRAKVEREGKERDMSYRFTKEQANRLVGQFVIKATALCIVFGIEAPDDRVRAILRKTALDTGFTFNAEIMIHLARVGRAQKLQIANAIGLGATKVGALMDDLMELKMVTVRKVGTGGQGRPAYSYSLSPDALRYARILGVKPDESKQIATPPALSGGLKGPPSTANRPANGPRPKRPTPASP